MTHKPGHGEVSIFNYGDGSTSDNADAGVYDANGGGKVWFPKPYGSNTWTPNLIVSSGAAGQGAAALNNPESGVYNAWYSTSDAGGAFKALAPNQQYVFNLYAAGLRKSKENTRATGESVFRDFIDISAYRGQSDEQVTPVQLVWEKLQERGWIQEDGTPAFDPASVGGSGAYKGPVTTTSYTYGNPADLRDLANQVGMTMVGRGVTEEEFNKIQKRVKRQEASKPDVTTTTPHGDAARTNVSQQGMTNADRQDVIESILAKNPEYGDYQKATTLMDWFDKAISERPNV